MSYLKYVPYVFLFAIATMIIYAWGLYKSQHAAMDDSKLLYSKAVSKILSELKKKDKLTRAELIKLLTNLETKRPFARNKIVVTEPESFADTVIQYMITQNALLRKKNFPLFPLAALRLFIRLAGIDGHRHAGEQQHAQPREDAVYAGDEYAYQNINDPGGDEGGASEALAGSPGGVVFHAPFGAHTDYSVAFYLRHDIP